MVEMWEEMVLGMQSLEQHGQSCLHLPARERELTRANAGDEDRVRSEVEIRWRLSFCEPLPRTHQLDDRADGSWRVRASRSRLSGWVRATDTDTDTDGKAVVCTKQRA